MALPSQCPGCGRDLKVKRLECERCATAVEGAFALPILQRLNAVEQEFALNFLKCGGALKELARVYKLSYPTVRNRLDSLMARIEELQRTQPSGEQDPFDSKGEEVSHE